MQDATWFMIPVPWRFVYSLNCPMQDATWFIIPVPWRLGRLVSPSPRPLFSLMDTYMVHDTGTMAVCIFSKLSDAGCDMVHNTGTMAVGSACFAFAEAPF
jgi:hypothetical protein